MVNAYIYYRDLASKSSSVSLNTLLTNPIYANQVLQFTFPNKMLEGATKEFQNNIKKIPAPDPSGVLKVSKQQNGMLFSKIGLVGNFADPTSDADMKKFETILTQFNFDTYHIYGNIGFFAPNALRLSLDPNNNQGYSFDYFKYGHVGQRGQIYDFQVNLDFGGYYTVQA